MLHDGRQKVVALTCLRRSALVETVHKVVFNLVLFALAQIELEVGDKGFLAGLGHALDALCHAVV